MNVKSGLRAGQSFDDIWQRIDIYVEVNQANVAEVEGDYNEVNQANVSEINIYAENEVEF